MRHIELTVVGMTCRRCVREVTARLRDVPGVTQVTADSSRSVVRVSGSMSESDVHAALAETIDTARVQVGATGRVGPVNSRDDGGGAGGGPDSGGTGSGQRTR